MVIAAEEEGSETSRPSKKYIDDVFGRKAWIGIGGSVFGRLLHYYSDRAVPLEKS